MPLSRPPHRLTAHESIDHQRLRALSALSTLIMWQTLPDGSMAMDSPAWQAFTGQNASECAGAGWLQALHPDDRQRVQDEWRQSVQTLTPFEGSYRLRRHDGQYRLVTSQGAPMLEAGGAVREWVGVCVDVTDALQMQSALSASQEQMAVLARIGEATRSLTDATQVMATTAQLLGEHLRATRCAYADVDADSNGFTIRADWSQPGVPSSAGVYSLDLFGSQATHKLRRGLPLVVNDVDAELGEDDGGRMFKAIGIQAIVCAGLVKEGRLVAMMAVHQASPRRWSERELAVISEVVDRCWAHIERVRDNQALREQDQRKDEFLATLAHELRNPLAPMRYALAILEQAGDHARRQQAQGSLTRQIAQMARLVDDLLDISRISRGVVELRRQIVPLRGLVEQSVQTVEPLMQTALHTMEVTLPEDEVLVDADPERIVQILSNLLTNAAKYTPRGGRVQVVVTAHQDRVELAVQDNGIGIAPEDQRRVFEIFTQLSAARRGGEGGLGIGLALVQRLVTLHEGTVAVHSAGEGQGARFSVTLPRAGVQAASGADTPGSAVVQQGPTAPALRILVVEDNPDGREMLTELLRMDGHTVDSAADGVQALQMRQRTRPQVMLLDLGLPGIDGIELARRIRAEERADAAVPRTHLIALTGWGAASDRQRTAAAGFDAHLAKPVDPDELTRQLAAVARAISGS